MPYALLLPCFLIEKEQEEYRRQKSVDVHESYVRAVRDAIRGGGCNTSRAGVVGATLAAMTCGVSSTSTDPIDWLPVPLDWIRRLRDGQELIQMARGVADLAASHSKSVATALL